MTVDMVINQSLLLLISLLKLHITVRVVEVCLNFQHLSQRCVVSVKELTKGRDWLPYHSQLQESLDRGRLFIDLIHKRTDLTDLQNLHSSLKDEPVIKNFITNENYLIALDLLKNKKW